MSTIFDKELFKNKLLAAGHDWSDQKIDNYLALKNASNNLKTEMLGDTNPALYDVVKKWETGVVNNPGAHVWTPELAKKFGAAKGTTFEDSDGKTMYHAKYDTIEQGEKASRFIFNRIRSETSTPEEFVTRYADKKLMLADPNQGIEAYNNYVNEVATVFSPQAVQQSIPSAFGRSRGGGPQGPISQDDKNYLWDFAGNALWNFLDLTTFGALGAVDPERALGYEKDTFQEYLTGVAPGESPETLAGRIGAGLGGVAGFITPFGIARGLTGKAVGMLPKVGAGRAASKMIKEGSKLLETGGKAQKGYKKFKSLDPKSKTQFFEPITQAALGYNIKDKAIKTMSQAKFTEKYRTNLSNTIGNTLRASGIKPIKGPNGNVAQLTNLVDKIAHINGKSVLRTSSLEELIALGIGGSIGSKKLAQGIATAVESALLFAATETPMELFQAFSEDREFNFGGRAAHAMLLGGMLGPIHYIRGGKDWGKQKGITRAAFKHIKDSFKNKRAYDSFNLSKAGERDQLRILAESYFNGGARDVLNSKLQQKIQIYSRSTIRNLAETKTGAKQLQIALKSIDGAFKSHWRKQFLKEAWDDLRNSSFRMFAGSMAFNWETLFHDDIPVEDKVFHIALGAFMAKRGRQLKYVDKSGYIQVTDTGNYRSVSRDFKNTSQYLDLLGMRPSDATFNAIANGHAASERFLRANLEHPDMVKLHDILKKKKVIDVNDGSDRAKPPKNKRGKVGQHPIYEQMKFLYDYNTNHKTKMVDVDRVTLAEIKSVETAVKNARFDELSDGTRGIETLVDLDHIHFGASDKAWQGVVDLHINAYEDIYNEFSSGRGFAQREESPGFPTRLRLFEVVPKGPISAKHKKFLNTYNKGIQVLADLSSITIDKRNTLEVENANFKNVSKVYEKHQSELNRLIHGEDISPSVFNPELMQDGLVEQVLRGQGFYKSVRDVHQKLNDFENPNLWRDSRTKGDIHQGQEAQTLIKELFHGKHYLYNELQFAEGAFTERQVNFANSLLKVLRAGPHAEVSMIPGMELPGKMEKSSKLNHLMTIFDENNIAGFSKNQETQLGMFVNSYIRYDFQNFIKGARKGDGTPLNEVDMNIVTELTRARWVGPNLHAVDIIGIMSQLHKTIDPAKMSAKQILDSINNHKDSAILMPALERVSNNFSKSVEDIATKLFKDYQDLIEPYMKTEKGGILQHDGTIFQPKIEDLFAMFTKLDAIRAGRDRVKYTVLMEELEKARNNNLTDYASQQLDKLYEMYSHGNESPTKIIMSLADNGLYNLKDNKLQGVDRDNLTLPQQLDKVLEEMNRDVIKDWPSTIENNLNTYRSGSESKKTEVEVDHNINPQSFKSKYELIEGYEFEGKTFDQIKKDITLTKAGRKVKYEDWDIVEQDVAAQEMIQVGLNTENSKKITKLSAVEGVGIVSDIQHTMYKNSVFKYLERAAGVDKTQIGPDGKPIYDKFLGLKYYVADLDVTMKDKTIKNVAKDPGSTAGKILQGFLDHTGDTKYFDQDMRKDWQGKLIYEQANDGSILVRFGDIDWGLVISKDPKYMRPYAKHYDNQIQKWKKQYGSEYKEIFNKLEKIYDNVFEKKEVVDRTELLENNKKVKEVEYELRNKSASQLTNSLQTLITFGHNDMAMPKTWWPHVLETSGGHLGSEVAGIAKRFRLMGNVSMKELSMDHVKNVRDIYKTNFAEAKYDKIRKNLDTVIKRGHLMDIAIAEDSGVEFTSVLGKAQKQIKDAQKLSKTHKTDSEFLLDEFSIDGEGRPTFMKGKDITDVDSYMAVSKDMMDVLYTLIGRGNVDGLGGMKPIIHRYGDNVIIGKTAFIHDRKLNQFFENNKKDAVLFESGSKINYDTNRDNVIKDWKSFEDLNKLKLEKDFKSELLKPEDISIGAVINADKKAHISHQKFINLDSGAESKAAFEWSIEGKAMEFRDFSQRMMDVFDTDNSTAYAKRMYASKTAFDDKGTYGRWLAENGPPMAGFGIRNNFIDAMKADKLDNGGVLKMQTPHGGQSVLSPGVDLKYPIFTRRKDGLGHDQYQYGESELPDIAGYKRIKIDRLTFIDRNPTGPDKLVKLDAIKGLKEAHKLKTTTKAKPAGDNITNLTYVRDLQATLKDFNKTKKKEFGIDDKYQIATVFGRNPSTRDGDIPIVGIKGFLHADYGNTAKINSWDLAMRLEGDYDIDKVDYWFDTPEPLLNKWNKISGERIRVVPGGRETKTSLPPMDWLKSETINKWANDVKYTKKLFGTVAKTRRTIHALRNYNSNFSIVNSDGISVRGLQLSRGDKKGQGIIYIDEKNFRETSRLIEDDMVNIIDSMDGYPKEIYGPEVGWKDNALFGDKQASNPDAGGRYDGIFKLAQYDDSPLFSVDKAGKKIKSKTAGKWIATDEQIDLSPTEKAIIRTAMKPYEAMLQLGSELYEGGKAQKVKYDDLMTGIQAFDAQMSDINKRTYTTLKKYEKIPVGELNEFFKNKAGDWISPLGDFGTNVRPHFYGTPNIKNMLPFERAIAYLAKNNELQLDPPGALYGTALKDFHNFYAKSMYTENYQEFASEFISTLRENNQFLNGINAFDYKIKSLKSARAEARQNRNNELAEWFDGIIRDVEMNRTHLEKQMINVSGNPKLDNVGWAKDLRNQARKTIRTGIIRNLKTPSKFPEFKSFANDREARKWIDSKATKKEKEEKGILKGSDLLDKYIKTKNMINFKGMHSVEHADLIFADNFLRQYENIAMTDAQRPSHDMMSDINQDISADIIFRAKTWDRHFNGSEQGLTISKASNLVNDQIEQTFIKWKNYQPGAEKLYLFGLMKPRHEKFTFTYFNERILPAFTTDSTNLFKTGINFISKSSELLIPEFEKQKFFSLMAPAYRRHLRALYGVGKNESHLFEENILDNLKNQRNDIFSGTSPLIDDIPGWYGGIQEMDLNPQMQQAFGLSNRTVAYNLAHQALNPSIIKSLGNAAYMAYMPQAYIGGEGSPIRYPAINGWTSYLQGKRENVGGMLGNETDLRLLQPKTPKVSIPFQDTKSVGNYDSKAILKSQTKRKVKGDGC